MIHNEREYKISKKLLSQLTDNFNTPSSQEIPEWVVTAHQNALQSQIEELKEKISEYENLKSCKDVFWECTDLKELPTYLIKARIASGLSQKQLAELLSVKPQQIQRYESSNYKGANLNRLVNVASALNINITGFIENRSQNDSCSLDLESETEIDWSKFPIKEMSKNGWISANDDNYTTTIKQYITTHAGSHIEAALHRKRFYGKNKPNTYSLIAWQARVLEIANDYCANYKLNEFSLDDSWIGDFVKLSTKNNAPIAARDYLADKGILLIIERHLEKTYLDGAAMLTENGTPVIALTLRHDRLDNFWFVLMHELGHIYKHMFDGLNIDFFDEGDGNNGDVLEREADDFALQNLLPTNQWNLCISKFMMTTDSVIADAKRLNISPAIIAGRIRQESGNFYALTDLVGNGTVRKAFGV